MSLEAYVNRDHPDHAKAHALVATLPDIHVNDDVCDADCLYDGDCVWRDLETFPVNGSGTHWCPVCLDSHVCTPRALWANTIRRIDTESKTNED